MGYQPPRKVYRIVPAEGHEYEGLEVRVRSVPLGQFLDLSGLAAQVENTPAQFGTMRDLFEAFAKELVEWNLEDDDERPLPATVDGLFSLDFDLAMFLIGEWIEAMGGVPDPLGPKRNGSEPGNGMEAELGLASLVQPLSDAPT